MTPAPKTVSFFEPVSKTNGATAAGYIVDTLGYKYAIVDLVMSASNDATNNPSVLKLTQGTTTDATNHTNISGAVGDTDFTINTAYLTNASNLTQFRVNLLGKARYLGLVVSPVTTQIIAAVAHLYRAEQSPVSAANAGVLNLVEIG